MPILSTHGFLYSEIPFIISQLVAETQSRLWLKGLDSHALTLAGKAHELKDNSTFHVRLFSQYTVSIHFTKLQKP